VYCKQVGFGSVQVRLLNHRQSDTRSSMIDVLLAPANDFSVGYMSGIRSNCAHEEIEFRTKRSYSLDKHETDCFSVAESVVLANCLAHSE
jgi:hypothetical protein